MTLRTIVITGASRGLGLASATYLYKAGFRVVAAMRSVDTGLLRLRSETGALPDDERLLGVQLDLESAESIASCAKTILERVGPPDVLVHNAGVAAAGAFEDMPQSAWGLIFATNVFGPIELTRALLPAMRASGRGRIVIVSSQGAVRGMPAISAYSASKAALERWGESLAGEVAPFGLGVSVIVTGTFKTDILVQTADYRNYAGPYAQHYVGIDKTGDLVIGAANPPERFARVLAKTINSDAPFSRHAAGLDAFMLMLMSRLLPAWLLHRVICFAMRLPRPGVLRSLPGSKLALLPPKAAIKRLPVAKSVPILGSAREMLRDAPGFVLRTAREVGPIFRIPLGPRTLTLIAHPQDLKQLLQDDNKDYPRGKIFDVMRPMLGASLPTADGEVWRRKRRTMQPGFNKPRIAILTNAMSTITQRYAGALQDGQRFDCHDLMTRVTRDIIVETMLSNQLGAETATLDAAFAELNRWVARYSFVPFTVPMWLPTPDNIRFKRARATFDRLIVGLIEARQKSGERHNDLLDALLEARDEEGKPMPASELRDEVAGLYFAGHETSANTLTWAFAMLAQHPEVFARVREEADRVLGLREPTAEDVTKLEYTGCVVRETLRLYPAGWILGRTATRDADLRGYQVKKGDFLGISPLVVQRLEENWPDPDSFDPERFAGDKTNSNRNFTYFPFGAGPHMCIGIHLALVEMQIVLAMFARRVNLVVDNPEHVRMTSKLTLQVAGGLPVTVQLRGA